jgi:hypothetical protein
VPPPPPTNDSVSTEPAEAPTIAAEESTIAPPVEPPTELSTVAALEGHMVAHAASRLEQEVMFVPLAVSVGDGFKFGCGFFLALVMTMLIAFVLFAALFVLTSLFGLNLPISR